MNTLHGVSKVKKKDTSFNTDVSSHYPDIIAESIISNGMYTTFTNVKMTQTTITTFTIISNNIKLLEKAENVSLKNISSTTYKIQNGDVKFYLKPQYTDIEASFTVSNVISKSIKPKNIGTVSKPIIPTFKKFGDLVVRNSLTVGKSDVGDVSFSTVGSFDISGIVHAKTMNDLYLDAEKTHIKNLDISRNVVIHGNLIVEGALESEEGAGIIKNDTDPENALDGDLYFNTVHNVYKYKNVDWINTEIGQIIQQPPPLRNVRVFATPAYLDILWDNPLQFPTSITTDEPFNTEHSPAVMTHPITNKNLIFFPIVNRICVKILHNGVHKPYPLYTSDNESVTSSISQIDPLGNVVYRKGDIVCGQSGYSTSSYTSVTSNHLLENMPRGIRFYKIVPPSNIPTNLPHLIMSVAGRNDLDLREEQYDFEIWLENNSLQTVNKQRINGEYLIAGVPENPQNIIISFNDNDPLNPVPRINVGVVDPLNVDSTDPTMNDILNLDRIRFMWSFDKEEWFPFSQIYHQEMIELTNGQQFNINRQIDNTYREYYFDLNHNYLGDDFDTEKPKLFTEEPSLLYVSVTYKNISNPAFIDISDGNTRFLEFDVPSFPLQTDISFTTTTDSQYMNGDIKVLDPQFVLRDVYPTLQFNGIKFEWSSDGALWSPFKLINTHTVLDDNGIYDIVPRNRKMDLTTYHFVFNADYLNGWTTLTTSTIIYVRVSYRNKSKPAFGEPTTSNILFEEPSISTKNEIGFKSTTTQRESECLIVVDDPENILQTQPEYNNIAKFTGVQFQWKRDTLDWNNFVSIRDITERTLTNGLYLFDTPRTRIINREYQYIINISYLGTHTMTDTDTKTFETRLRYRNNAIYGDDDTAYSEWLESSPLLFDKPSTPRKNEIDYLGTLNTGITRINQVVLDPEFLLGENNNTNNILNYVGIRFTWKADTMSEWVNMNKIRDTRQVIDVQDLINGEYVINYPHSDTEFTYTFDLSTEYLGSNITDVMNSDNDNIYVRIEYKNSAISQFSDLSMSNVLKLERPAQPSQFDLSFNRTMENSITECILYLNDPNVLETQPQYNEIISFTGIKFEWKIDENEWNNFSKIKDVNTPVNTPDGIHTFVKSHTSQKIYKFDMTSEYLNSFTEIKTDQHLYVRVRYRNSTVTHFSDPTISNSLLFERPSIPINVDISFEETLDISNTRYIIRLDKPENVLATTSLNNPKIHFTGLQFQMAIDDTERTWYNLNSISLTKGTPINIDNGIYVINTSYTNVPNLFYIDTTTTYIPSELLTNILTDQEKQLVIQVRYRNSTVPEFSDYKDSNLKLINVPDEPKSISTDFWSSYSNQVLTDAIINIERPDMTILNGQEYANNKIKLTGIRFEWKLPTDTNWNNFLKIKETLQEKTLTDGILTLSEFNNPTDVSYIYNISTDYFGTTYTVNEGSIIYIKTSYRNSTIGQNLINGYGEHNETWIEFTSPSNPFYVELSFNVGIGTPSTPLTQCKILMRDPLTTLKTINNQGVFLSDISFEWRINESEWNVFDQLILESDQTTGIPYDINRARDDDTRVYRFDTRNNYLNQFNQIVHGDNLQIRSSYRNTILPHVNGSITTSNNLLFQKPSEPVKSDLSFNVGVPYNSPMTECFIGVIDPANTLLNANNQGIYLRDISFEWQKVGDETWKTFKFIRRGTPNDNISLPNDLNRQRDETERKYYFEANSTYLNDFVDLQNNDSIRVQTSYSNSILPTIQGLFKISDTLLFQVPSNPVSVILEFNQNTNENNIPVTECIIKLRDPENTLINANNQGIYLTDISFEWKINTGSWNSFNYIQLTGETIRNINGIPFTINRLRDNIERTYIFRPNSAFLNNFSGLVDEDVLYVRASYRNSILPALYSDVTESNGLVFEVPNEPTELDIYFRPVSEISNEADKYSPVSDCQILIIDPNKTLKTNDEPKLFFTDVSFNWRVIQHNGTIGSWNIFNKIRFDNVEVGLPHNINRSKDTENRFYNFKFITDYLNGFGALDDGDKLQLQSFYRNSALPTLYGLHKTSNELLFRVPDEPREVNLYFRPVSEFDNGDSNIYSPISDCQIEIIDPSNIMVGSNTFNTDVFLRDISFNWRVVKDNGDIGSWKLFKKIRFVDTQVTLPHSINRPIDETTRYYNFKYTNDYVHNIEVLNDGDKLQVNISYRNAVLPTLYGITKSSNELLFRVPDEPAEVNLYYRSLSDTPLPNGGNYESITDCQIEIKHPLNTLIGGNNQDVFLRDLSFNWKLNDETTWNTFNKIRLNNTTITSLPHVINTSRNTTSYYYNFKPTTAYLNGLTSINDDDVLYVKAFYRNSILPHLDGLSKTSNELLFQIPSKPTDVILNFRNSGTFSPVTDCEILVKDPLNILKDSDSNNSRIYLNDLSFNWKLINSDTWNTFKTLRVNTADDNTGTDSVTTLPHPIQRIINTDLNTYYNFKFTNDFLNNFTALNDGDIIHVRAFYRNSILPQLNGTEKISNELSFEVPNQPEEVHLYFRNIGGSLPDGGTIVPVTDCQILVKDPPNTLKTNSDNNNVIHLTDVSFNWSVDNSTWYTFNNIRVIENNNSVLQTDINISFLPYTINRKKDNLPRYYNFKVNSTNLNNYNINLFNDNTKLKVKVIYRNSILPQLNGTEKISNDLSFNIPSAPVLVDLSFNRTHGTQLVPITECSISLVDPANTLKTVNNPNIHLTDISFEWKINEGTWNRFDRIKNVSNVETALINIPFPINRVRNTTITVYKFDISNQYLNSYTGINDGNNLYVRTSYRNSVLPHINGEITESNALLFAKPSDAQNVDLSYNTTASINTNITRYQINLIKPVNMLSTNTFNNTKLNFTGILIKWRIGDGTWNNFNNFAETEGSPLSNVVSSGIYRINQSHNDVRSLLYFDSTFEYMGSNNIFTTGEKNLQLQASYRNSAVPEFGNDKNGNALLLNRPSIPQGVVQVFQQTVSTFVSTCKITITNPLQTISGDTFSVVNNVRTRLRRIKFEWKSTNDSDWNLFTGIKTTASGILVSLTDGILPIDQTNADTNNYFFDTSSNFMGSNVTTLLTNGGTKTLYTRVSYSNHIVDEFSATAQGTLVFEPPSAPSSVSLALHSPSGSDLASTTRAQITVVHPENTLLSNSDNNSIIKLTGVKFEWSIDNSNWNVFNNIRISDVNGSNTPLTNGITTIDTLRNGNDNFYFFEINNDFLNGYIMPETNTTLRVRVSYRNSTIPTFGATTPSNISYNVPAQPSISNVVMINPRTIRVTMNGYSINNVIQNTNQSNASYIKQIELVSEYKLDDNNSVSSTQTLDFNGLIQDEDEDPLFAGDEPNNSLTNSENISTYIFRLPNPVDDSITANNNYRLRFKVRTMNNLINAYSIYSNVNNFVNEPAEQLYITSPISFSEDPDITSIHTQHLMNIGISSSIAIYTRGATKILLDNFNIPLIRSYDVEIYNPDVTTNRITVSTNTTSSYNYTDSGSDATNTFLNLDISNIIIRKGVSTNPVDVGYTGDNSTDVQHLRIDISGRNHYVKEKRLTASRIPYRLSRPVNTFTIVSSSNISNITNNTITLSWTKPDEQGFFVGTQYSIIPNVNSPPPTATTHVPVSIKQYTVQIVTDRANSKSPYYKSSAFSGNNPEYNVDVVSNSPLIDASLQLVGGQTITKALKTDVFVFPETVYTFNITARNLYNINSLVKSETMTTNAPILPSAFEYYTNLPTPTTVNYSAYPKYTVNCFVLNTTAPNDTTPFTPEVSVIRPMTANNTMTATTHVINRQILNKWLSADTIASTYLTDVSSIKIRQFQVINVANNNSVVYELGNDTNLNNVTQSGETTNMIYINITNRSDIYSVTYDNYNRGYWWRETVQTGINFNNKTSELYGKPIRLNLVLKQNNAPTDAQYNSFTFSNAINRIDNTRLFLHDTANSANSNNAYFDNLVGAPTYNSKEGINPIAEHEEHTNKINGIPHIYPLGTIGETTYVVRYRASHYLENYSSYFGMTGEIAYYELITSDGIIITTSPAKVRTLQWTDKPIQFVRESNRWNVDNLPLDVNVNTSLTTPQQDIRFRVNFRNQTNTSYTNQQLTNLFMLYDKNTVETFKTILNSLQEVPSEFLPDRRDPNVEAETSTGTDPSEPLNYISFGTNTNPLQISMHNGQFVSNALFASRLLNLGNHGITELPVNNYSVSVNDRLPTNYRWAIFKYRITPINQISTPNTVFISFGIKSNFNMSDIHPNPKIINPNVKVFFRIGNSPTETTTPQYVMRDVELSNILYSWFNVGNAYMDNNPTSGSTATSASAPYSGTISSAIYTEIDNNDFINGDGYTSITTATSIDYIRMLVGYYRAPAISNTSSSTTISAGQTRTYHVAVGIRNDQSLYFERPRVFIARGQTELTTFELTPIPP
jgi:hypothetical protein